VHDSSIKQVMPQIRAILKAKIPIVSTTEELSYPGLYPYPTGGG
jgi:hypothetical protein